MKTFSPVLFTLTLAACGGGTMPPPEPTITLAKGTAMVKVDVGTIRSSDGEVRCSLFNAADGFPGPSPIVGGGRAFAANGGTLSPAWEQLPTGRYAVSCIHDENANGKLDTNVVGAPMEGTGSTNNIFHPTGPATFDEASFEVDEGETVPMQINLKY